MLFYYQTTPESIEVIKEDGIRGEVVLHAVQGLDFSSKDIHLVVDPLLLSETAWYGKDTLRTANIPVTAIQNVDPYLSPRLVIAGGGFLVRQQGDEKEIALIYRRQKWDIPKGKLDPGETYEACAVREVQEELGIQDIQSIQPLGSTWHCYDRKGKFCIKRTYWYEMETSETVFHPQEEEDIEEVTWFPWSEAKEVLGFPVFSMHMTYVEPLVMK